MIGMGSSENSFVCIDGYKFQESKWEWEKGIDIPIRFAERAEY